MADRKETAELFFDVVHLFRKYHFTNGKHLSLTSGQYQCLFLLDDIDEISQRKLSELLMIRPTSLSETISKLEKKGFVTRNPSNEDKRTYMVSLTQKGKAEVDNMRKLRADAHLEVLAALTDDEVSQFSVIMQKIKSFYKEDKEK